MKAKIGRLAESLFTRLVIALAILTLSVSGTRRAQAVQYNSSASSTWCGSTLQQSLNNSTSTGYLQTALGSDYANWVKKLDNCSTYPSYMRLVTQSEWNAGKESYKTGINSGTTSYGNNYLPNTTNAWTGTANGNNLYQINYSSGDASTAVAATSDLDAYPVIELNCVDDECSNLCVVNGGDGLGTVDNPYTLTTDCNTDPTITVNSSDLILNKTSGATFAGTYTDGDTNQTLTITVTLTDKNNHTITKTLSNLSNGTAAAWSLNFTYAEVLAAGLDEGIYSVQPESGTDSLAGYVEIKIVDNNLYSNTPGYASFNNQLIIDWTNPNCGTASQSPWTVNTVAYKSNASSDTISTSGVSVLPWNLGVSYPATMTLDSTYDVGESGLASNSYACSSNIAGAHGSSCTVTIYDNAGNSIECRSPFNRVDTTAPTPVCYLSANTNTGSNVYLPSAAGTTGYYKSGTAGIVDVKAQLASSVTSLPSSLAQASFADVDGSANVWTNTPSVISATSDDQLFTSAYSWTSGASTDANPQVTLTSGSGQNAVCSDLTFYADAAAPTGFSLGYTTAYLNQDSSYTVNLSLNRSTATDDRSGINENSWALYESVGTLSDGNCTAMGAYTQVTDTSRVSWTNSAGQINGVSVIVPQTTGKCYQYQIRVSDNVGNEGSVASANFIKVDTTDPVCGTWTVSLNSWSQTYASNNTSITSHTQSGAISLPWNSGYAYNATLASNTDQGGSGITTATSSQSTTIPTTTGGGDGYADLTIADNAGNTTVCRSPLNTVDANSYTLSCTIGSLTGDSYTSAISGVTYYNYYRSSDSVLYYNPYVASTSGSSTEFTTGGGSFVLTNTISGMPAGGVDRISYPQLVSNAAYIVDRPSPLSPSAPRIFGRTYNWNTSTTGSEVDAANKIYWNINDPVAETPSAQCLVTVYEDHTAPTGVAPGYADSYTSTTGSQSVNLGVNVGQFSDDKAGIKTFTIQRRTATLSSGNCDYSSSAWTTPAQDYSGAGNWVRDFSSMTGNISVTDTLADGTCYQYRFVVTDQVGNQSIFTTSNSIKVSTSVPSNNLYSVSDVDQVYWDSVSTIYYGRNPSAANIDVTVEAIDNVAGINYVNFQNLAKTAYNVGTNAGSNHYYYTYALPTNGSSVAGVSINAVTNSSVTAPTSFNLTFDGDGPTGVAFTTCPGSAGSYLDVADFTVIGSYGTDALSTVDDSLTYIERAVGHLNNADGGCYYDAGNTVSSADAAYTKIDGTGGSVDRYTQTTSDGACYAYRLVSEDHVGNVTRSSVCEVAIDRTAPTCSNDPADWEPVEIYPYKSTAAQQAFRLKTYADAYSGVDDAASYGTLPDGGTTPGFTCTADAVDGATCTVTVTDRAGKTATCTSPANHVDEENPSLTCIINEGTNPGYQYATTIDEKPTLYYNANSFASGSSFDWEIHVDEPISGIRHDSAGNITGIGYADLAGSDSAWSQASYTGSNGVYHRTYTWSTGAGSRNPATTTFTYGNDLSNSCQIALIADNQAPQGGSLGYTGRYLKKGDSQTIDLQLTRATDDGTNDSGIDESSWQVWRYAGTLADGVCSYGDNPTPTQITPTQTFTAGVLTNLTATDILASGRCYKYELRVSDLVGNQAVFPANIADAAEIKVDTTAPVCGTDWDPAAGTDSWDVAPEVFKLYYNDGADHAAAGSYDTYSGVESVAGYEVCTAAAVYGATCDVTISDRAGNTTTCTSPINRVDNGEPTLACTITLDSGANALLVGNSTVYYNPSRGVGNFYLNAANVSSSESGVDSVEFPALADTAAETVTPTTAGQSSFTKTYNWTTTNNTQLYNQPVTMNFNNDVVLTCQVSAVADSQAPTGPDLGYLTQVTNKAGSNIEVSLGTAKSQITDAGVGINNWIFQYERVALGENDSCPFAGDYTDAADTHFTNISDAIADADLPDGTLTVNMNITDSSCYRYRVLVTDKLGNVGVISTANYYIVDSGRPSIAISNVSQPSGVYFDNVDTIYYAKPTVSTALILTADASAGEGYAISNVAFQDLTGEGTSSDTDSPYMRTYTLPVGSTTSYADRAITAYTNSEPVSSANTHFNVTYDGAGPSDVAFTTCPSTTSEYLTANSFAIKGSYGSDALSGLDLTSSFIEGQSGTFTNGACSYSGDYTRVSDYAATDYSVAGATDGCYRYRLVAADNVGNLTRSAVCEVKVDLTDPVCGTWEPEEVTVWNRANVGQRFVLSDSTDTTSGINVAGGECTTGVANGDTCTITISDNAGRTSVCRSPINKVDTNIYDLTCSLPADIAGDYWYPTMRASKPTLYFNPSSAASGTWRLTASMSQSPSSGYRTPLTFSAIAGGWTSSNYTESGLDIYQDYTWTTAGATGNANTTVDITYGNGQAAQCTVAVLADSASPVGSSLDYGTVYVGQDTAKTIDLKLTRGRDLASGIDETSWSVYKSVGTLAGDTCSDYSSFTAVPASELQYTTVNDQVTGISIAIDQDADYASGRCYKFQLRVSDMVGNTASVTSSGEVKIDLTAPNCGATWQPDPSPWKNTAVGQTFELLDSIDALTTMSASYYSCTTEASSSATCWVDIADVAGNTARCQSPANRIDLANPDVTCGLVSGTGTQYLISDKNLLYYNPAKGSGTFRVVATADEQPRSGIAYAYFPALAGSNEHYATQSASVTTPTVFTRDYAWSSTSTRSSENELVWVTYGNYNSNTCSVSVIADSTAPAGSAPKYKNIKYGIPGARDVKLGITAADFADDGAGLATLEIQRIKGTLGTDNVCTDWQDWGSSDMVSFGANDYTSYGSGIMSVNDDLQDMSCYRYRVVATDRVDNVSIFTAENVIMVNSNLPEIYITSVTPTADDIYYFDEASTIYYGPNSNARGAQVTTTARTNSTAVGAGITQVLYENFDRTSSTRYTYPTPTTPTYQDHFYEFTGLTSTMTDMILQAVNTTDDTNEAYFDVIYDSEGPQDVAFTACPSGWQATDNFTIAGSYGTDRLSGNDNTSENGSHIERAVVPLLANGTCDTASAVFAPVGSVGDTTYQETDASEACYIYRLVARDHVRNETSATCTVKVDLNNPTCGSWTPAEVNPWNTSGGQTFILAGSSDSGSGIKVSGGECATGDKTGDTCTVSIYDHAGRMSVCTSPVNKVDGDTPELTCTITEGTAPQYQYATTVGTLPTLYYNNGEASSGASINGSFLLGVKLDEPSSHITSKQFPVLAEGWTAGSQTSASGHYTQAYSWVQGAAGSERASVKFAYGNGTSGQCNVAIIPDHTAPVDGSLGYATAYINQASTHTVNLGLTRPTDSGSGIDEDSWTVWRSEGTLSGGTCSAYGAYSEVSAGLTTTDGKVTAIATTDTLESGKCYRFQVRVSDNVGNIATIASPNEIKVDTTAPVCGTTWDPAQVPWKNTAANQTFTLYGSTDTGSGIGASSFTCSTVNAIDGETCDVTIYDQAGNTATCTSPTNNIDDEVAALTCQVSPVSGTSYLPDDSTIYYNPSLSAGNFTVRTTAASVPSSGIAKVNFPALAANTAAESSRSATGNPRVYERNYTWDTTTRRDDSNSSVTMTFGNNNTSSCQVSAIADPDNPIAPASLTYATGVTNRAGSRELALGLGKSSVTDSGSGIKSWTIQRATGVATYTGDGTGDVSVADYTCNYECSEAEGCSDYATINTYDDAYLTADAIVANDTLVDGKCYRYRVLVTDNVSNTAVITSTNSFIVDTNVPEISIDSITSTSENFYYDGATTAYYAPTSGSNVTVLATATGGSSGTISSTAFQNLNDATTVAGIPGADINTYYRVYYLNDSNKTVYADRLALANNGLRAASTDFTLVYDDQAPAGRITTCPAGAQNSSSFSIKVDYGADPESTVSGITYSGSGLDTASSYLVQQIGTLAGGACSYPADLTADCADTSDSCSIVATGGVTNHAVSGAATNTCYRYLLVSTDKVGNQATTTSTASGDTCQIAIDLEAPTCGSWDPAEVNPWRTSGGQPFTLVGSSDAGSGLSSGLVTTCTTAATTGSTCSVTLTDRAGNTKVCQSPENKVDPATPALTCTLTPVTNTDYQHQAGSDTLYYSSYDYAASTGRTGSFQLTTQLAEPDSGITSVYYPPFNANWSLTPAGTGTHEGGAGTYTKTYAWAEAAESTGSGTIVYTYGNGTTASCRINVINDQTAPSFSLGYTDQYVTNNGAINLQLTGVSDTQSGINDSTWRVERIMGTTVTTGNTSSCDLTGAAYEDTAFTYSAGTLTATANMTNGHCYRYRVSVADNVANITTVTSTQTVYANFEAPVCGTWTPADPVDWKSVSNQQLFVLTDSDGGVSGMAQDSYSCTAVAVHGATCQVTITNNVGVSTTCTSPANRIDLAAPTLEVTPAVPGWTSTRQNIDVTAVDTLSGLARIAYAWNENSLGDSCTGGTTIASGSNIGITIDEGQHTLYVCAVDNVGHVSTFTDTYYYASMPSYIDLIDNVADGELTWNVRLVPTNDDILIEGYIPAMSVPKNFTITLAINGTSIVKTIDVSTIAGEQTGFTFAIPVEEFGLTLTNYTFPGPHTVTIRDNDSGMSVTKNYNISFYFPIYNTLHRANSSAYMYADNPDLNP